MMILINKIFFSEIESYISTNHEGIAEWQRNQRPFERFKLSTLPSFEPSESEVLPSTLPVGNAGLVTESLAEDTGELVSAERSDFALAWDELVRGGEASTLETVIPGLGAWNGEDYAFDALEQEYPNIFP